LLISGLLNLLLLLQLALYCCVLQLIVDTG
jgi:hypothetical protein